MQRYAAYLGAFIVALGFAPASLANASLFHGSWVDWCLTALSFAPLIILTLSDLCKRSVPAVIAVAVSLLFLCTGTFVTVLLAALSGGGTEIVTLHGMAMTIACATSILLISPLGQSAKRIVLFAFGLPVLAGIWSLTAVPLLYSNAIDLAAGRAFCFGEHGSKSTGISSAFELRGFSFYTTRSGYKIGDTWYFHGLLLVEGGGETHVFNWSPRRMEFQPVMTPHRLFVSPFDACEPSKDFHR
jgi:hypothetical protein